jgi:hypothetical protein
MGRSRSTSILFAVLALLGLTMLVAVAQGQGGESSPAEGVAQVTTIEAEAEAAMAVLESSRTSSDVVPSAVAEPIDENARFGMNPDLSRVAVETLSHSLYVIPANGHVCAALTVGDGANVSCPATETVADGESGPATVTLEGGAIAIYGIVPDGVESVTVETGVSASDVVETDDNAYYTVVEEGTVLQTVSYDGPSGEVEFPIYDPSEVFEE